MVRALVLEPCSVDLRTASEFGVVSYVFGCDEHRCSIWSENFTDEVLRRLETLRYDPASDVFVVAGHMVPLAMVISVLTAEYRRFKALLYSATEHRYILRTLGGRADA